VTGRDDPEKSPMTKANSGRRLHEGETFNPRGERAPGGSRTAGMKIDAFGRTLEPVLAQNAEEK